LNSSSNIHYSSDEIIEGDRYAWFDYLIFKRLAGRDFDEEIKER